MKQLEILIVILSMIGSTIISFANNCMFWGFVAYIIANIISIIFFYRQKLFYLTALQVFFLATSINGIVRTF